MSILTREFFESEAARCMETLFEKVPSSRKFHSGEWMNRDYYIRHLKETVLRIRLNNEVDAYALYKIGSKDNALAAHMAKYLCEEYGHEHMFVSDLSRFGVSIEELNNTPVFFATEKLIGYLRLSIDRDGPAPSAIWSWFVEWYSDRYILQTFIT